MKLLSLSLLFALAGVLSVPLAYRLEQVVNTATAYSNGGMFFVGLAMGTGAAAMCAGVRVA